MAADDLDREATNSGTKPVAEAQRFDVAALEAWMADQVEGYAGPLSVRQFKGGQSNPTYELATPGRTYVLRRKPPGKLLPSAHAVDREHRIIAALYPTGFPVPKPYGLCADEGVIGTMFYVMQKVEGRIFWDPLLPGYPPRERGVIHMAALGVMADLHNTDYLALGLEDFGRPGNYMARQIDRWTRQYRASETQRLEAMEQLIEWLPATVPPQERTAIVHGDYRLDNMVVHPTQPRVSAVLDWELSTLGDPLADFTYHLMQWVTGPIAEAPDLPALGVPTLEAYVAEYCRLTGREGLPDLNWYMAYNNFRLAGIVQGIAGRVRDGTASSSEAAQMAARVPLLSDAAWRFARLAGA